MEIGALCEGQGGEDPAERIRTGLGRCFGEPLEESISPGGVAQLVLQQTAQVEQRKVPGRHL